MLCLWEESAQNHQRSDTEESKDPELPAGYQAPLLALCPKEIRRHKAKHRDQLQPLHSVLGLFLISGPTGGLQQGSGLARHPQC